MRGNGVVVYKMSGSGNDFVMADGRTQPVERWTPELIREVCARGTGVGADGLAVLEPGSRPGAVRFHFFNSDGSRAPMCGNGALCATRLAAWLELAPGHGLILETDAGNVEGRCLPGDDGAEIVAPPVGPLVEPEVELAAGERSIHFTTVGVPHVIVRVDDLTAVPLLQRGRALRSHSAFPDGANVNFLADGAGGWAMRTYERGVEAETLACGTGAVAATAVLASLGQAEPPIQIGTASGTVLTISADLAADRSLERARLAGPARIVFRGVLGG